jgi:hypothetical protein
MGLLLLLSGAPTQPVLSQQDASTASVAAYERAAETANRLAPGADAATKVSAYSGAMEAAERAGNIDMTLEWGERVLALEPSHRLAQMYVSSALPERLPTDEARRTAQLTRAMELANKAHAQTEAYFKAPKPVDATEKDWAEQKRIQEARVHDTLGVIHLIREEYDDSVFMYEYVVTLTPENGQSQYNLGAAYSGQSREAEEYLRLARQDEANARGERAPADRLQGLTRLRMDAEADFILKRDKAIETLARAVALGGTPAQRARPDLERLYRARNSGAASMEELVNLKKAELGVR